MFLVTGATGTIGSHVVRQLVEKGASVRALTRDPSKAAKVLGPKVEVVKGDLKQSATVDAAMRGVEGVLLCSPPSLNVVDLYRPVLGTAARTRTDVVVAISVLGASKQAPSKLLQAYGHMGQLADVCGANVVQVRPHLTYQAVLHLAQHLKRGQLPLPMVQGSLGLIDARDVAQIATLALTGAAPGAKAFDVTGPDVLSGATMASTISRVLGRPLQYADSPPTTLATALAPKGWGADATNAYCELWSKFAAGPGSVTTETFQKVTGEPPRSFERFCRDHRTALMG